MLRNRHPLTSAEAWVRNRFSGDASRSEPRRPSRSVAQLQLVEWTTSPGPTGRGRSRLGPRGGADGAAPSRPWFRSPSRRRTAQEPVVGVCATRASDDKRARAAPTAPPPTRRFPATGRRVARDW